MFGLFLGFRIMKSTSNQFPGVALDPPTSRRKFLARSSHGFGAMALWHLLARDARAAMLEPHFTPRAKNVIFLFMMGGQSHLDLFDPKPKMAALHGQPIPAHLTMAKKSATGGILETVQASPRKFQRHGECGMELSDFLPHTGSIVDDICLIRSMHCEQTDEG